MQNRATTKMGVAVDDSDRANSAPVIRAKPTTEMTRGPNLSNTTPEMG